MEQNKVICSYVKIIFLSNTTCHVITALNTFSKLTRWSQKFVEIIFKISIPQCVAITMTNQCMLLGKQSLFILRIIRNIYSEGKMHNSFMIKPVVNIVTTVLNNKSEELFYTTIKMSFETPHLDFGLLCN